MIPISTTARIQMIRIISIGREILSILTILIPYGLYASPQLEY